MHLSLGKLLFRQFCSHSKKIDWCFLTIDVSPILKVQEVIFWGRTHNRPLRGGLDFLDTLIVLSAILCGLQADGSDLVPKPFSAVHFLGVLEFFLLLVSPSIIFISQVQNDDLRCCFFSWLLSNPGDPVGINALLLPNSAL